MRTPGVSASAYPERISEKTNELEWSKEAKEEEEEGRRGSNS